MSHLLFLEISFKKTYWAKQKQFINKSFFESFEENPFSQSCGNPYTYTIRKSMIYFCFIVLHFILKWKRFWIFYFYFTFRLDSGVLIKKKTQDEGATLTLLSGLRTQVPAAAFFVLHKICIFMLHSQKMLPFKKLNKLSEHAGQGAFLVIQGPRVQAPPAAHVC